MNTVTTPAQTELFKIPYNQAERLLIQSGIRYYTLGCSRIPAPIVDKYFDTYYLLYWRGTHLLEQIQAGLIEKYDQAFKVVYHNNLTRGNIIESKDSQFALSFRAPKAEWGISPTVLIWRA